MLGLIGVLMLVVGGGALLAQWIGIEQVNNIGVPTMAWIILAACGAGLTLFFRRPAD